MILMFFPTGRPGLLGIQTDDHVARHRLLGGHRGLNMKIHNRALACLGH